MSESGHHRSLVLALTKEISIYHGWAFSPIIYCDVQDELINDLPPIIGSNRPDVLSTIAILLRNLTPFLLTFEISPGQNFGWQFHGSVLELL